MPRGSSKPTELKNNLAPLLLPVLDDGYRWLKSKQAFERSTNRVHERLVLTSKPQPFQLSFDLRPLLAISHTEAFELYKRLYPADWKRLGWKPGLSLAEFHEDQWRELGYDGPRTWMCSDSRPSPALVDELRGFIREGAKPFFERFSDLREIRDVLTRPGKLRWPRLLLIRDVICFDILLDDVDHLGRWLRSVPNSEPMLEKTRRIIAPVFPEIAAAL